MKLIGTLLVFFLASFATAPPPSRDGLRKPGPEDILNVQQRTSSDGKQNKITVSANPEGPHPRWDPNWFGGEERVIETLKEAALGSIAMTDYDLNTGRSKDLKSILKLKGDPQKTTDSETAYTWTISVTPGKAVTKDNWSVPLRQKTATYVKLAFDGKLKPS